MANKSFAPLPQRTESVASAIVHAAIKVHKALGPGLLESIYEDCLVHELTLRGIRVTRQVPVSIVYEGLEIEGGLRLDLMVEDEIIVELKAVDQIHPVHEAQVLSYLRLAGKRLGFLINFNVPILPQGIRRFIL